MTVTDPLMSSIMTAPQTAAVTDPLMSSIMTAPQTAAVTDPLMSSINKQGNYCDLGFSAEDKLRQSSHLSTEKLQISQFT